MKKIAIFMKPVILLFLRIFYNEKYLTGQHFESGLQGCIWGIRCIWARNILRLASPSPFPIALSCTVSVPENIIFHPDDLNNFQSPGTYFQNFKAKIYLGKGAYIAPNVGLITADHDVYDLDKHVDGEDIIIGDGSWIGMNSVILPGVCLGPHTIVAAGAVVTKSLPEGYAVLAGVPAKVVKKLFDGE